MYYHTIGRVTLRCSNPALPECPTLESFQIRVTRMYGYHCPMALSVSGQQRLSRRDCPSARLHTFYNFLYFWLSQKFFHREVLRVGHTFTPKSTTISHFPPPRMSKCYCTASNILILSTPMKV